MRFNNKNMTPGQYIKMYRRGGSIKKYQDGSEMDPGMYDPEANIYSPNWQMDENVQLYEEDVEENVNPQASEVVCQMCDNGSPINLPANPDGTCPPGSTVDDGQTNPCDPSQPGSADYSDIENQEDVKAGHRQKYGSKGTIPDWLTAAPIGDKGNLADLILTTRSIINSYKPENYKGKFSFYNLPSGQEGGDLPKAGYGWGDLWDDIKGAGKFVSNMTPTGMMVNTARDVKADYDAGNITSYDDLKSSAINRGLDNTQQGLQGAGFVPGYGILADGTNALISKGRAHFEDDPVKKAQYNVDAATNLVSAVPFAGDVVGAGATLDMVTGSNVRNQIAQNYVDGQNVSPTPSSPSIAQAEDAPVEEEYIPQSQRESKYGGALPKAQTGYFNDIGDEPFSFGEGQGLGGNTKILSYDDLNSYIKSSQAQNPRTDFINSRPNVILTNDNAADWLDNHADWTQHPSAEWEAQVKELVYSGTHGYNPATGALVRLDNAIDVHPDKKTIATKEYHDAGYVRLPDDPEERANWIMANKDDIIVISAVPTGDLGFLGVKNWTDVETYMQESPNQGYYQALTKSGLAARNSMLSDIGQQERATGTKIYDNQQQFELDSLMSDPNTDPNAITNQKLDMLLNPETSEINSPTNFAPKDTTLNYAYGGAMPYLQTGGAAQGGYMWEWSPDTPDPLLLGSEQMIGPQNQPDTPSQNFPFNEPVEPGNVPPMQDSDNDGISDFVDADSATPEAYGPENAPSNISPGTYDPDIYTFNQPELDEAVDTQDDVEYYEPEGDNPDANDNPPNLDENVDDSMDDNTDEAVNPDEGDDSPEGDTTEEDDSSDDDDAGAEKKGSGRSVGETITKTAENVVKAGKFLNAYMDRRNKKKEKEKLMRKTIADNMFEADDSDISGQKGDYDTNTGLFRTDDKVVSRKGKYGLELLQPGGATESDIGASITLDDEGARPRIEGSFPIASTYDDGYRGCYKTPTGELSAACEIEGGVEFDPSSSMVTSPDQINEYTIPTGNQPFSDTNIFDADGDGQITMMDAEYDANNPLPTEETVTEVIPGTTKRNVSLNPTFNIGAKGNLGYTSPSGIHLGATGRAGFMGSSTDDINPYYSARGDIGYVGDNYAITGFGEQSNIRGTDVGLRGSADLGGVELYGEGRYNIPTGGPQFTAGVRIPFEEGGEIVDIDFETYKELIAAGAELEIM